MGRERTAVTALLRGRREEFWLSSTGHRKQNDESGPGKCGGRQLALPSERIVREYAPVPTPGRG